MELCDKLLGMSQFRAVLERDVDKMGVKYSQSLFTRCLRDISISSFPRVVIKRYTPRGVGRGECIPLYTHSEPVHPTVPGSNYRWLPPLPEERDLPCVGSHIRRRDRQSN